MTFINCSSLGSLGDSYSKKEQALLIEGGGAYKSKTGLLYCCLSASGSNGNIPENIRNAVTEFAAFVTTPSDDTKRRDFFQKLLPPVTKVIITTQN